MSNDISLVVFDCDGTMVDSQHSVVAAMTEAWRAHGLSDPEAGEVRRVIGLPLVTGVASLLPEGAAVALERVAESYRRAFFALRRRRQVVEPLFPGAHAALDAIEAAGRLLGIATGKSRRGLIATLEGHGLAGRFVTLNTADDAKGKPAPDMVLRAMAEVGAGPEATLVVGDTVFDMAMARNAGVRCVGVGWGYHPADELAAAGADRVVHSFAELPAAIAGILPGPPA